MIIHHDSNDERIRELEGKSMLRKVGSLIKLNIPTYEGTGQCIHPSVVFIPGGLSGYKYWMAFTPYPDLNSDYENPSIVASNDCINWVVPAGLINPLVQKPVGAANADSTLIWDGTTFHLYWLRIGGSNYRISSTDGLAWSEPVSVVNASLKRGMYYDRATAMFYSLTTLDTQIGWNDLLIKRCSIDGITFYDRFAGSILTNLKNQSNNGNGHGSAYSDGAGIHFINNINSRLYYGYSPDGNRAIFDPNPILTPTPNTFTSKTLYTSCIVPYQNGEYMLIVSGISDDNKAYIGCMRVKLNLVGLDFSNTIKRAFRRTIFDKYQYRSTSLMNGPQPSTLQWPVPEFNEYSNMALAFQSSFDTDIKIVLSKHTYFYNGNYTNTALPVDGTIQEYTITSGLKGGVLTKDTLKALGVVHPAPISIGIQAVSSAPSSGDITLILSGI